jgi:peptide/nickel transport system permease protein
MSYFILRRLGQAVITVFSVMLLTFILFRLVAGDVSAQFVNPKLGKPDRVNWLHKRKLDLPLDLNFRARIVLRDQTDGNAVFAVEEVTERYDTVLNVPAALLLQPVTRQHEGQSGPGKVVHIESAGVQWLDRDTLLASVATTDTRSAITAAFDEPNALVREAERWGPRQLFTPPTTQPATAPTAETDPPVNRFRPRIRIHFANNTTMTVDLTPLAAQDDPGRIAPNATVGDFIELLNEHPDNDGRLIAETSKVSYHPASIANSQFFWHLRHSVTFQNRSYKTEQRLMDIIAERAKYSLALTVPALALSWLTAMVISSVVAYYRGGLIDKMGVFLSVLGMCIPYLVYMIAGQAIMFHIAPSRAYGIMGTPSNIFVPIAIAVIAGLGSKVRFYRTIILDEIHRDYVRTARAKGVPLPGILFRHVMKNCMLPILTSLVVSIPFLIMGSLLLERFFGIPGLGSLMVNSVSDRDVPMITGLTFLTSVIYVISLLLTDILYAVFDPRVRLR